MNKNQPTDEGFAFAVAEDDGKDVVIEVSEADYRRERAAGIEDDALLKPGRYRLRRGGFQARHSQKSEERKRA